jgi:hypothetical protein
MAALRSRGHAQARLHEAQWEVKRAHRKLPNAVSGNHFTHNVNASALTGDSKHHHGQQKAWGKGAEASYNWLLHSISVQ